MKPTNQLRLLAIFCAGMALSPMVLTAQTTATPVTTTSTTMTDDNPREEHHNYGWIGLLGLLGLAPLLMGKRTDYRGAPTTTDRTGGRPVRGRGARGHRARLDATAMLLTRVCAPVSMKSLAIRATSPS